MVKADSNLSPTLFRTNSACSQDAITGGLLSGNPTTSGHTRRRSRKVKELAAVYESQNTALRSKFQQRTSEEGRSLFANQVKREKLLQDHSSPKSTNHFHDVTDSEHTNYDNEESKSDSDDLSIECMTLKNMKQRVLSKKRKILRSVASPRSDLKNDRSVIKIKLEEVEPVLEESLITLKSKVSEAPSTWKKRRKRNTRYSVIALDPPELTCASGSTESCGDAMKNMDYSSISSATELRSDGHNSKLISSVNVETCSVEGHDSPYDLSPMPGIIKRNNSLRCFFSDPFQKASDVIEMDTTFSSVSEMKGTLHIDPEFSNCKQVGLETAGELERVDERERQSGESIDIIGSSLDVSIGKVTIDTVEPIKATCILECGEEHFGEIGEMSVSKLSSHQTSSLPTSPSCKMNPSDIGISMPVSPVMGLDSDVFSKESHNVSVESMHTFTMNTLDIPVIDHNHESMEINNAAGLNFGGNASSVHPESGKHRANGDVIEHLVLHNEETDLGEMFRSNMEVASLTDLVHKAPLDVGLNTDRRSHVIPCTGEHSRSKSYVADPTLHFGTCFSCSSDIHPMEGSPRITDSDGLPDAVNCDSQIYPCSLGAVTGSHSDNSSCNTAEEFSSPAAYEKLDIIVDASISASASTSGSDDVNKIRCDPGLKVHVSPRKILSNRQTFSPDSQKKLRRALTNDLDDGTKHPEAAADLGPDIPIKKQKINRKAPLPPIPKGILKSQDASCITPCSGNKSSPVQNQTEETIKFSLRQMHDIRTIAAKLLRGLKSMKSIVEETQCTETCSSAPSKFTADEIRMVTEEASELEATTNKWLTIMSKDCNRFCKILRTENKSDSPDSIYKKRKKLLFADEAGGKLCHVKFFNQQPAAASEINESVREP